MSAVVAESSGPHPLRVRLLNAVVGICFFLLTFWDIYFDALGLRGFDIAAFALFPLVLVLGRGMFRFRTDSAYSVGFSIYFLVLICVSLWNLDDLENPVKGAKTCLGVFLGLCVFNGFTFLEVSKLRLERVLSLCLYFHISAMFLQSTVYYATGEFLDYSAMLGSLESRALSNVFRATGFYQEPAAYSITMLMLLALRVSLQRRLDWLVYLTLFSCISTFSLTGLVGAGLFFVSSFLVRISGGHILAFLLLLVSGSVGVTLPSAELEDSPVYQSYDAAAQRINRITTIDVESIRENDGSLNARYGGIQEVLLNPEAWEIRDFLGRGISAEYHRYGSNGLAFLVNAGGFLSLLLVGLMVVRIFLVRNLFLLPILTFSVASAPMWTHFFWWIWLGFLVQFNRVKSS